LGVNGLRETTGVVYAVAELLVITTSLLG